MVFFVIIRAIEEDYLSYIIMAVSFGVVFISKGFPIFSSNNIIMNTFSSFGKDLLTRYYILLEKYFIAGFNWIIMNISFYMGKYFGPFYNKILEKFPFGPLSRESGRGGNWKKMYRGVGAGGLASTGANSESEINSIPLLNNDSDSNANEQDQVNSNDTDDGSSSSDSSETTGIPSTSASSFCSTSNVCLESINTDDRRL